jgi:hypothetical protein
MTTTKFAWVIEHGNSTAAEPHYFAGFDGFSAFRWSRDHAEAVRFSRERDAAAVARGDRFGDRHRVCEHGWTESGEDKAAGERSTGAAG